MYHFIRETSVLVEKKDLDETNLDEANPPCAK